MHIHISLFKKMSNTHKDLKHPGAKQETAAAQGNRHYDVRVFVANSPAVADSLESSGSSVRQMETADL